MRPFVVAAVLAVAVPSFADVTSMPRRALLPDAQGATPGSSLRGNMFLWGLGLVGAGLALGGAGFAILYVCREGQQCHQDKGLTTTGWVLAAPGIVPLAVGLFLMYLSSGSSKSVHAATPVASFDVAPLPGGAFASGTFRF